MAILYEAVIPLNPRTKKNSQRLIYNKKLNRPMIIPDEKYKEYEKNCGYFLKKLPQPISEPVNVKCVFYRETRIRCDLTNLLEAIDDVLVLYGVLSDDNYQVIIGHDGSRVFIDRENPRTEITITTVEGVQVWAKK